MPTAARQDPYRGYHFKVEIDGITCAAFRECSGLDSTQDGIDYRCGTDPIHLQKLPGLVKHSNIVLKRGLTDSTELWDWRKQAIDGKMQRKNGSIVVLNEVGEEKFRFNFTDAWPSKYTAPTFNATANEVAIETLEIVYEDLQKG